MAMILEVRKWNIVLVAKLLCYLHQNLCQCMPWYPQEWAHPTLLSESGLSSYLHQTQPGEQKQGKKRGREGKKKRDEMFRKRQMVWMRWHRQNGDNESLLNRWAWTLWCAVTGVTDKDVGASIFKVTPPPHTHIHTSVSPTDDTIAAIIGDTSMKGLREWSSTLWTTTK